MLLVLLVLASGCSASAPEPGPAPAALPHAPRTVVLVVIDTWRWDAAGFEDAQARSTPSLDAFAREGTVYTHMIAHGGWTLPSMASLMTGLLPSQHHAVLDPLHRTTFGRIRPTATTLAEVAHDQGFATGAFVNNAFLAPEFGFNRGYDDYDWASAEPLHHRTAEDTVARARAWLGSHADVDTFLWVHLFEPHLAYGERPDLLPNTLPRGLAIPFGQVASDWWPWASRQSTPDEATRDAVSALYASDVRAADRALGPLVADLRQRPHSLVVVTADHGEELWDHGGFEHGSTLWSEILHVPTFAWGEGISKGRDDTLHGHSDIYSALSAVLSGRGIPSLFAPTGSDTAHDTRAVVSEGTLYGPDLIALTEPTRRTVFVPSTRAVTVSSLDGRGQEVDRLLGADLESQARAALQRLTQARGGLEVAAVEDGVPADRATLEHLRALGYVE